MAALPPRPLHLAIGMFDGVHLGHRAVIEAAVQSARRSGGVAGVLTCSTIPLCVKFAKPGFSATISYVPGGTCKMLYAPVASASTLRLKPVWAFCNSTLAEGIAPPCGSLTMPRIELVACPQSDGTSKRIPATASVAARRRFVKFDI